MPYKNLKKKAAMEMSVGTIVTIVLPVSVLVLGLLLIQNIFSSAKDAVDLTDNQLKDEIQKIFSEEKKLVIYPGTTEIEVERGETSGIGIGVRNRLRGDEEGVFDYSLLVDDSDIRNNCGVDANEVESWIRGKEGSDIALPIGNEVQIERVLFDIPENAPLCSVKMRVKITVDKSNYATDSFFLTIK